MIPIEYPLETGHWIRTAERPPTRADANQHDEALVLEFPRESPRGWLRLKAMREDAK